jgi:hypothetical protein
MLHLAARRLASLARPLSRGITMSTLPFSKLAAEAELAILSVLRGCYLCASWIQS